MVLIIGATIVILQQIVIAGSEPADPKSTASQQYNARTAVPSAMLSTIEGTQQSVSIATLSNTETSGESPHAYSTISLDSIENAKLDFESPPVGEFTFEGIPFVIADKVYKSQASTSPNDSFPTSVFLPVNILHSYRLYLLVNAGNGFARFSDQEIGRIVTQCGDVQEPAIELVLGQNIREWHKANNVVSVAPETQQIWSGTIRNYPSLTGYIDMLRIDLPVGCQSGEFAGIDVVDTSTATVNSLDPALNLGAITVEHGQ